MAEYIEREAAIEVANRAYDAWNLAMATADGTREINLVYKRQELCKAVASVFDGAPAADVAPVVRCKECKHRIYKYIDEEIGEIGGCGLFNRAMSNDDFCSYGERKENENV